MTPNSPPKRLANRYTVEDILGEGGFARVYLGHDERLNRKVAIKLLLPERIKNVTTTQRFLREAQTAAGLQHPLIVQMYDIGQEANWHYLIMEYVEGETLRDIIDRGRTTTADAIAITEAILTGLAHAHSQSIIHRDIKPANIIITQDGTPKIADFGLAWRENDLRLTATDTFVGTVYYLAPEVIEGKSIDVRTDLYSVGIILYEMLTGNTPFTGKTMTQVISNILKADFDPPTKLRNDIPEELNDILLRLLARNPAQRFSSAQATLNAMSMLTANTEYVHHGSDEVFRQSAEYKLGQSRLERFVKSSDEYSFVDEPTIPIDDERNLLLFAAQEDTIEALEVERRRIATTLENALISKISLILSQLNAYETTMSATPQTQMALSVLSTLIRDLLQEAHDLTANLRPAILETLGLEPALENYANQQRRASGIALSMSLQRMRERLPIPIELTLFRATQDAIDRAIKQANATTFMVELRIENNLLRYTIDDNGMFPVNAILQSTQQRIKALGGQITFDQSRYGGLQIDIRFLLTPAVELTEREMDVVKLLGEGLTNKEIAALLHISPRTVKFHLDNIYTKMNVNSRTEAAIYALRQGWITQQDLTN